MLATNNSRRVIVTNPLGLHARPAAMVAKLAMQATSDIWLIKDDQQVDASSIIDILALECPKGTELVVRAEKDSDRAVVENIAALFEKEFKE